jgi:hypothetical protein
MFRAHVKESEINISKFILEVNSTLSHREPVSTARVFRSDSRGKAAQWLATSIRESWGVLWLVIRLLSVRADVSSCYKSIFPCTAFPSTLVSMLELSSPLPVLLLLRVGGLSRLNTRALIHVICCHLSANICSTVVNECKKWHKIKIQINQIIKITGRQLLAASCYCLNSLLVNSSIAFS